MLFFLILNWGLNDMSIRYSYRTKGHLSLKELEGLSKLCREEEDVRWAILNANSDHPGLTEQAGHRPLLTPTDWGETIFTGHLLLVF